MLFIALTDSMNEQFSKPQQPQDEDTVQTDNSSLDDMSLSTQEIHLTNGKIDLTAKYPKPNTIAVIYIDDEVQTNLGETLEKSHQNKDFLSTGTESGSVHSPAKSQLHLKKPLLRFRSRSSSSSLSPQYFSPAYVGPHPLDHDGRPLKSCIRRYSSSHSSEVRSLDSTVGASVFKPRKVTFSGVAIREYCRECGDNPSVSSGPPLAIGWSYNKRGELDIETYEADKIFKSEGTCRRLSALEREKLLIEIGGHHHGRILTAQSDAYLDRLRRGETIHQLGGLGNTKHIGPRERVIIMKESASRKIERVRKGTSTAKEQLRLWEMAQETVRQKGLRKD